MSQFAQIKCKRITKKTRMGHETGMKHICLKASVQGENVKFNAEYVFEIWRSLLRIFKQMFSE